MSDLPGLNALTLDEKIGQLFVHAAHGRYMSESSPEYLELVRQVRDLRVGGIIWLPGHVLDTASLIERLQGLAAIPLLISADLEAGAGMRFPEITWWPPAMAIAATGDVASAELLGRITAREAHAIGIHQILAPVADVNVNAANPVINTRSFGEDPREVSRYVEAFVRGVKLEGLFATVKHFPGHGDTAVDSHRSLPTLDVTRERLEAVELVPFRSAIEAGVDSVMVGHLAVPLLDPTPIPVRVGHGDNPYGTNAVEVPRHATMPATLSKAIVTGLLREEMGFDGLVVTDAFDMGGVVEHFEPGEAAVRSIDAGCDQILMSADTTSAIAAVKAAVTSGRLSMNRIDEAVSRVFAVKKRMKATPPLQQLFDVVDCAEHREAARLIAEAAITLVHGDATIDVTKPLGLLVVSDIVETVGALTLFEREVRARVPCVTVRIDARTTSAEAMEAIARLDDCVTVIVALAIRARTGHGSISLTVPAREAIATMRQRLLGVSFGSPYLLRELPALAAYFCAYGPHAVMQRAAARILFGEIEARGRLPVAL